MQPDPGTDRATIVDVASELLMAAVTLRDIASSLHPTVLATCPPDILRRLTGHRYQAAFDELPVDIRREAQARLDADPDIRAARAVHSGGGPHAA
jgi:hypothetical protein